MKLRWITLLLLGAMGALLALSEQAGQAVRQGLSLCAGSVIPSLFPFFVLSSLFTSLGGGAVLWRLPFFSRQGSAVFFLGALGGYPLGGRLIDSWYAPGSWASRRPRSSFAAATMQVRLSSWVWWAWAGSEVSGRDCGCISSM